MQCKSHLILNLTYLNHVSTSQKLHWTTKFFINISRNLPKQEHEDLYCGHAPELAIEDYASYNSADCEEDKVGRHHRRGLELLHCHVQIPAGETRIECFFTHWHGKKMNIIFYFIYNIWTLPLVIKHLYYIHVIVKLQTSTNKQINSNKENYPYNVCFINFICLGKI